MLNFKDIDSSRVEEKSKSIDNRISLTNKKSSAPSMLKRAALRQGAQGKEKR